MFYNQRNESDELIKKGITMTSNLKPWFRDDLARVMMSVYFSSLMSRPHKEWDDEYRVGFAAALSSIAIIIGINPESILGSQDIGLLREFSNNP
jgi:hypothetical protein